MSSRPTSFWDSFAEGDREALGSHLFTTDEIRRFAARYDPQIFHLDEAKARASVLGGLCASGWHTASIFMKLNVETRRRQIAALAAAGKPAPKLGPSPGVKNLRWPKPVYAGDIITYSQTVIGKRTSKSRPGWGVVEFRSEGVNEAGETVFSVDGSVFCGTG